MNMLDKRFTDSFLEIPCLVFDQEVADIIGKKGSEMPLIEVVAKIIKTEIDSYAEAIPLDDFRSDNKIWTGIQMKSGQHYIVNMPLDDFEKLLNTSHVKEQTRS